MQPYLTFLHTLSSLHAGTGQGVDVIDLPIAREKATGLPLLPGSSLKGTLLDAYRSFSGTAFDKELFGTIERAGRAQFTDQRLLALPVRSLAGTFAWVSSPYLLARFARDARDCAPSLKPAALVPPTPSSTGSAILVRAGTSLICTVRGQPKIVLEDLDFVQDNHDAQEWATYIGQRVFQGDTYWQGVFAQRFCIVHDDVLAFLLMTATEVTARVRLEDTSKTVAEGGLWYEEALPAESILSGLLLATAGDSTKISAVTAGKTIQFGGKASVGRGLCRLEIAGMPATQPVAGGQP